MSWSAAIASILLSLTSVQDPPNDPASQDAGEVTELSGIVVEGRRTEDLARDFVAEVAAAPQGSRLARWDDLICVGAANMERGHAQFLIDRVSRLALDLGLAIGEPGCRSNVMIVATDDGASFARALVEDDPQGYRPGRSATDLGGRAMERFQSGDAPVRWWHVSLPVHVDTGEPMHRERGTGPAYRTVRGAARLSSNTREDLARVLIIVDVSRIGGVSLSALSDYVSMVALAQIDAAADTSAYQTILNLFSETDTSLAGLTEWDRDYLRSLYEARRDRANASQQSHEIIRGMTDPDREDAESATLSD